MHAEINNGFYTFLHEIKVHSTLVCDKYSFQNCIFTSVIQISWMLIMLFTLFFYKVETQANLEANKVINCSL